MVEPEVKESYIKKIHKIEKEHFKKYGYRHNISLDALFKEIEER